MIYQSGLGKCICFAVFVTILLVQFNTFAQSNGYEQLSLIDSYGVNGDESVKFNIRFQTDTKDVVGEVVSYMENYDSLAITSYGFVNSGGEKILKINAFVINKSNNKRLKWVAAIDYNESPRSAEYNEVKRRISGKFIQFGAFNVYSNATRELAALVGFEIIMIKVNDQFKLISPYEKSDFTRARKSYPDKNVWVANYDNTEVISLESK